MTKQTGTIITVVVGVLSLCCASFCCLLGGIMFTGGGEWSTDLGIPQTGQIDPLFGIGPCCLSILILVVPLLLCWFFLLRDKEESTGMEMEMEEEYEYEGTIEDDNPY